MPTAIDLSPHEPAINGASSDPEMPSARACDPVVARSGDRATTAAAEPNGGRADPELPPPPLPATWYVWCKPVVEYLVALVLFVLAAPVILVSGLVVKLTSRGPMLYTQTRVGRNGRPFTLYKIRTMIHDCEKKSGVQWSKPGDPRITRVGAFLRKTHLDELPQLWNVLTGAMSLVGPRPERPEFTHGLERAVAHYRDRLAVRPGVTGLAQVQLPPDTNLASVRRKLAYDLYYIRHLNGWLDFRLIACTALRMFGVPFRRLTGLFFLPNKASVELAYQVRVQAAATVAELESA